MLAFPFVKRTLFWLSDLFHGGIVFSFYTEMDRTLKSKAKGKEIQEKALNNILDYASKNSPYYSSYKGKCIESYPIVDKVFLKEHMNEISVPIEKIAGQKNRSIFIQKTSGSTGMPFAIPMDFKKRKRRIAEIKWFNNLIGFHSHDMLVQCRVWTNWHNKKFFEVFKENIIPVNIQSMNENILRNFCQIVKKNKAKYILAYAGWYDALVSYIEKHPETKRLLKTVRACISCSEALNPVTEDKLLNIAGIPIIERYSNEEGGMLGQKTLYEENFILNHSGYFFEFLKLDSDAKAEPGELSRIVITDLYNHAFPLIRYDTGDTAIFAKGDTEKKGWEVITKLYGRRFDLIFDTNGNPVHPMSFARVLKNIDGIRQWQFVQNSAKHYLLKLNTDHSVDEDKCRTEIMQIMGRDSELTIEYVQEIPVLKSGKRKAVINNWRT